MGVETARVPIEPERVTRNGRRFFSEAHKRAVVERCLAPGASVSAVSLAHGFNTNLVRKWIGAHQARQAGGAGKLVPVTVREAREMAPSRRASAKPAAAQAAKVGLGDGRWLDRDRAWRGELVVRGAVEPSAAHRSGSDRRYR